MAGDGLLAMDAGAGGMSFSTPETQKTRDLAGLCWELPEWKNHTPDIQTMSNGVKVAQ